MVLKKKSVKPRTKLTIKQDRFVDEYIKTGNLTEAAAKAYKPKSRTVASAIWSENLTKLLIAAEIKDRVTIAKDIIFWLAQTAEKEEVQLRAAQDIVDRGEGKPTQKIISENHHSFDVEKASTEELINMIKWK